jgi:hypothetical protein
VTAGAALQHPILQRAAASARKGELCRETPVLLRLDDGSLVEGVVDLAFHEDTADFSGWTVVDFKTDREFATSSDRYTAQVGIYRAGGLIAKLQCGPDNSSSTTDICRFFVYTRPFGRSDVRDPGRSRSEERIRFSPPFAPFCLRRRRIVILIFAEYK